MKTVLIFIGLKITEVSALIFVPYLFGRLYVFFEYCPVRQLEGLLGFWLMGFVLVMFLFLMGGIVFITLPAIFKAIFKANWEWAKTLKKKL